MAAILEWKEDNGAAVGSPPSGTTRTGNVTCNWKNIDDATSLYSTYPITVGNNSYTKYQFIQFSGVFTQISNVLFNHVSGNFTQPGFTLKVSATSGYATPSTVSTPTGDYTKTGLLTTGLGVLLGTVGPNKAGSTTLASSPGYSQYLTSQLITTASAANGDLSVPIIMGIVYDEV